MSACCGFEDMLADNLYSNLIENANANTQRNHISLDQFNQV